MSEIRKRIDQIIKLGLADFLKSHGFKKSGRRWSKQTANGWLLVGVQASSVNRGTEGKFAVNLGIYNSAVEQLAERLHYREGEIPRAEGATLECRLNDLGFGHDHWWEIKSDTDPQLVSNDVVKKMSSVGIPWLLESNDVGLISDILKDSHSVVSFSAALLLGDEKEVVRRINRAIKERPRGAEHFLAWAKNAGVKIQ